MKPATFPRPPAPPRIVPARLRRLTALALAAALLAASPAQAELIVIQVSTGTALSIECTDTLAFGTIIVPGNNSAATVTVAPSAAAVAVPQGNVSVAGASAPVDCTVIADDDGPTSLSFALSGGSGAFNPANGSMAAVLKKGSDQLDAVIQLNAVSGTVGAGAAVNLYIGGTLTVPAGFTQFGNYQSDPITVTVTQ